jgi:SPP1 gp7 family putative phage head morphogenesis protein
MNKRQKQVIQSQLNDEKATLNKLKGIYKKALDDVNDRLAALKGRAETENLQSVIYQIQYQEALKKQINGILDTLNGDQFNTISEYLTKSYESGFVGVMYDIHGQGVPLIFPIDQDQVVQAVTLDTKLSKPLYNKLGEDVNLLKKRVANNISRGIAQGQSYSDIAKNIAVGMVGDYARMNGGALYNAMRITRTEAHRISQQAAYDALKKAKDNGADVVKQWDATLDKRTRTSHARVDGEIRELDEPFSNGLMKPGDPSGRAAEVINCRCQLLQRARCALDEDELDELKERAAYFGLDKTANFEEFRQKYMPASIANSENSGIILARNLDRKSSNTGVFSNLGVTMQKKEVKRICEEYGLDVKGLTFKIQRSEHLLNSSYYGSTDYDNIGRIDLFPNAFQDEEELIKTIIHEKCHVEQLKRYGKKYCLEHLADMEAEAYQTEEEIFNKLTKGEK